MVDNSSPLEDQISCANVGIIINSTVGLDMVLNGLLVLQFKIEGLKDDTRYDSFGYVKPVRNSCDIVNAVKSMARSANIDEIRKEFIRNYISRFGDKAVDAILST